MSRLLYADLAPEDLLLADLAYGSYVDESVGAPASSRCGFSLFTMLVRQIFASCKKLGIGDHQIIWYKPKQCPRQMSEAEFAVLPTTLMVRFVCLRLTRRGFRDQTIIVVTTLLDAKRRAEWH